jgi:MFS family permease
MNGASPATSTSASPPAGGSIRPLSSKAAIYSIGLLTAVNIINLLDRQVINIVAEPMKLDLHLSDAQLGLLGGLMFGLLYTFIGLPIARLAERFSRPAIISASLVIWSGFTVLCGLGRNFAELALARAGVGAGEAGCSPAAYSLISDYVAQHRRALAFGFYASGTSIGALFGMAFGGLIADAYGWRAAFFIAGAPGLVFAILTWLTLREPRRQLNAQGNRPAEVGTFLQAAKLLMTRQTFCLICLATGAKTLVSSGFAPFIASFFLRNHGARLGQISTDVGAWIGYDLGSVGLTGLLLGLIAGLGGTAGALLGGYLGDRYGSSDNRFYLTIPIVASLVAVPVMMAALLSDSTTLALALLVVNALLTTLWYGPVLAACYSVVPAHTRATASAIYLFASSLIGLGLGPLSVGLLSDSFASGGLGTGEGLRWALFVVGAGASILAATLFWLARRKIRGETIA